MTDEQRTPGRGLFVAIEGGDGTGKSTQAERCAVYLRSRGLDVLLVREPGGTPVGERVREIFLSRSHGEMGIWTELFLAMAARAQLVEEVVRPALEAGRAVVSDRFLLSSVVYQGVAGGLGAAVVEEIGHGATGGLRPDLTVVVDLDAAVAAARLPEESERDRMEGKGPGFHERVLEGYRRQAAVPGRGMVLVSGAGTPEEVEARVREELRRVLE